MTPSNTKVTEKFVWLLILNRPTATIQSAEALQFLYPLSFETRRLHGFTRCQHVSTCNNAQAYMARLSQNII